MNFKLINQSVNIYEYKTSTLKTKPFLADRTNGRTYVTVLRLSVVVCLWRYVLWLNGASYCKSYYWEPIGSRIWEIDWYQNEWPW